MAIFRCDGMEHLEKMLKDISTLDQGRVKEEMLIAGGNEVKKAWETVIERRDLKRKGDMLKSVKFTNPKHNAYGTFISIYPFGKIEREREDGSRYTVRNAEKAFMLHYGFLNHANGHFYKDAKGWVDDVEDLAMDKATKVMEKIYENYLKSKG